MFEARIKIDVEKFLNRPVAFEFPPDSKLGDIAIPCFQFSRDLKKSPDLIAKDIAKNFRKPSYIKEVKVAGAYVNFFYDKAKLGQIILENIHKSKDKYGSSKELKGKTIVIDFSSPNIAKPFGIGHLRSTVIGNSLCNIHKFFGCKVIRINHLGDWGTQFGKLIYAHLAWGDRKKLKEEGLKYLMDIYVKFHNETEKNPELEDKGREWFKKLEQKDAEALKLWAKFRKISLDEFKKIYKLLNVGFDSYNGESFYNDKMEAVIDLLRKKDICEMDQGAEVVKMENMPPCILKKGDEASTYALRDLAAIKYRMETYNPNNILYVVGSEQNLHFQQVFSVAQKLGWNKEILKHINFGLYLSPEGGKISTRKGKTILMEEVLKETIELARKTIEQKNPELNKKEEIAEMVGIGAVIFGDLVNDRTRDVVFDWEKILDFEGDTAPYIQYTYARASSIVRKAKGQNLAPEINIDFSVLQEEVEQKLIVLLSHFQEEIRNSLKQYKPHIIAQYLLELGRKFNEFYHKCNCLQEEDLQKKRARLLLIDCSRQAIKNGLSLLGIKCPEEM